MFLIELYVLDAISELMVTWARVMTSSRPWTSSMVLVDLGKSIHSAIQKLSTRRTVDEKVFDEILKDLCRALLEADVNVRLVAGLRNNIKSQIDLQQLSKSTNKKRIIQRVKIGYWNIISYF